ncbi:hypothetical protein OG422_10210 [Streptomyces sp. NBC_01525]
MLIASAVALVLTGISGTGRSTGDGSGGQEREGARADEGVRSA